MRGRIIRLALAAVGLYCAWPALVQVFGSYDELSKIKPAWFLVMVVLELASYVSVWLLIGLSTASRRWTLIALAQLAGNAVSSIVPGGGAVGGPLQYTFMVRGGEDPDRVVSGLAATSLLSTTALFGLSALSIPLVLRLGGIDDRLEKAAWLGSGVFVVLLVVGILAFSVDGFLRGVARGLQWVLNAVRRRKAPSTGLPVRVLDQRDRVRDALGAKWPWAIVAVVAKWAFDYFALVAAVAATGVRVDSLSLFLAYVTASVLSMIPITPGGLGFVEAGLAATLVWAGLPSGNATLATLAYRLVSYWLPLVVGTPVALFMRGKDAGGGTSPTESSVRDLGPDRNDPIRP